jgi:hypothetical protein
VFTCQTDENLKFYGKLPNILFCSLRKYFLTLKIKKLQKISIENSSNCE